MNTTHPMKTLARKSWSEDETSARNVFLLADRDLKRKKGMVL
jgi:hypothetical protein